MKLARKFENVLFSLYNGLNENGIRDILYFVLRRVCSNCKRQKTIKKS